MQSVLLGPTHITVTKKKEFDWSVVKPSVELVISQFFDAKIPIVRPGVIETVNPPTQKEGEDSVEKRITDLMEERVRPFVQQDGGDVEFVSFDPDSGLVKLRLCGSCSGCPKSNITLKHGIERMLRHYVPEVTAVMDVSPPPAPAATEEAQEKAKEFGP